MMEPLVFHHSLIGEDVINLGHGMGVSMRSIVTPIVFTDQVDMEGRDLEGARCIF